MSKVQCQMCQGFKTEDEIQFSIKIGSGKKVSLCKLCSELIMGAMVSYKREKRSQND